MLHKIKLHPRNQILAFAIFISLATILCYTLEFQPRIRFTTFNLAISSATGIIISLFVLIVFSIQHRFFSKRFSSALPENLKLLQNSSSGIIIAAALISGTAEELLFRGFVFNYLLSVSPIIAFLVNSLLSYGLYYSRSTGHTLCLIKMIEGTCLALLFWWTSSIFALALARFISEAFSHYALCNKRILSIIENEQLKDYSYAR